MKFTMEPTWDRSTSVPLPGIVLEGMDREALDFIQNLMVTTQESYLRDIRAEAGAVLSHWDSAKGVAYIVLHKQDTFEFMCYFATEFMCKRDKS